VLGPWIQPAAAYARYLRMSDREMAWLRERFLPVGARQAARYLAEHTSPDDCILIAGSEPEIYYYAGRKACTRLIFTYPLTGRYTYAAQLRQEFVADLVEHRPRYVVLVTDRASWTEEPDQMPLLLRPVMDVLEREYQAELTLGPGPRAPPSIVVYLRKGA
jgi:hypothetical protein